MAQEHSTSTDSSFDIDTDVGTLSAFAASSCATRPAPRPPETMMSLDQWLAIPLFNKSSWNQISSESKAIILGNTKPPTAPAPLAPNLQHRLNLHDISLADYLDIVQIHQHHSSSTDVSLFPSTSDLGEASPSTAISDDRTFPGDSTTLMAHTAKQARKPPSCASTTAHTRSTKSSSSNPGIPGNIRQVLRGHVHWITYRASTHKARSYGSLVDRGVNDGLAGNDVMIIYKSMNPCTVDVSGFDDHQLTNLFIVAVGGIVQSQRGPVIAIMHQNAYVGRGKTIHSSGQIECYKSQVHDGSLKVAR